MATVRTAKEIKADIDKARETLWAFEAELKEAKEHRKRVCPHTVTYERDKTDTYYEEGRMAAPAYYEWKEKVCKRCGKVLATKHPRDERKWGDWQDED